jgi:hypothetical protein
MAVHGYSALPGKCPLRKVLFKEIALVALRYLVWELESEY